MSSEVTRILDELHRDHHHMSGLLDLLEREASRIHDGKSADHDLMLEIMRYMAGYPDAVHHPREDRLYDEVRRARPDLTAGFEHIAVDHKNLAALGRRLRDDLASLASGVPVNRRLLADDTMRYVNAQRSHMQWEEIDLFRRCRELAANGHRFPRDFESGEEGGSPVDEAAEEEYGQLLSHIQARAPLRP